MVILIIILVLLLILTWILVAPVIMFIDTAVQRYQVTMPGIFAMRVVPSDTLFYLRFRLLFIPFRFDPLKAGSHGKKRKRGKAETGKKRRRGPGKFPGGPGMVRDLAGGFRVRKLHMNIDTEDVVVNAWLVPVFTALNTENIRMQINFEGDASLLMDLRTRLGRLLWIFLTNRIRSIF